MAHGEDEDDDIAAAYIGKTEHNKNKSINKKSENKQKNPKNSQPTEPTIS